MHQDEFSVVTLVRVGIGNGDRPVGCPSGVSYAEGGGRARSAKSISQVFNPACFPGKGKFATLMKSDARGIIPSVFQATQTVYEGFLSITPA